MRDPSLTGQKCTARKSKIMTIEAGFQGSVPADFISFKGKGYLQKEYGQSDRQ